jgi:putative NADH-flavin reductase
VQKIIVFGATGGTGKLVVEQALAAGHQVTAVVRDPRKITFRHKSLKITKGDVLHLATFENEIEGQDVVVSCLGIQKREPTTVYSDGTGNIIKAMQKENVGRLICLSAVAVIVPPLGSFLTKLVTKNILQRIFRYTYADMLVMEKIVRESNLNWTVISPPWLRDSGLTSRYRTAINESLVNPTKLSRADLADFIMKHLIDEKTYKARIEISY